MKQLRVLTGRHAGTQLMLSASMYRIDSSEQADIQLTDWQSEPLVLELQETDSVVTVTFTSQAADESQPAARELLADFVPKRFGDVVLCVGPMHAQWPSDVELLELLMRPVVKAVEAVNDQRRDLERIDKELKKQVEGGKEKPAEKPIDKPTNDGRR
jgi:type III secretion protein D